MGHGFVKEKERNDDNKDNLGMMYPGPKRSVVSRYRKLQGGCK